MEEPFGCRHGGEQADFRGAARLSHDRHVRGIAAEVRDVVVHPLQGGHDVEHPDVARTAVFLAAHGCEVGESERVEPVVHRAEDDVAVAGDVLAVVAVLLDAVAACEAAAVEPHEHRTALAVVEGGRPYVQTQAVFAHQVVVPVVDEHRVGFGAPVVVALRCRSAVGHCRAHALPRFGRSGRHEAVFAARVGAVGDAAEAEDVAQHEAAHLAVGGLGHGDVFADEELLCVGVGVPLGALRREDAECQRTGACGDGRGAAEEVGR